MKKYIYKLSTWAIILAAFTSVVSCGDFLSIEPRTFVSEDNFWNEKTDMEQMVHGTYIEMQNDAFIRRCIVWGEVRSDNTGVGLDCTKYQDLYRVLGNKLMSTNGFTDWKQFYTIINRCNTLIEMAPVVHERDPKYTESDMNATVAEMSFMRALSYFYLVRAFKDVPYYTYAIRAEDQVHEIAATDGNIIVQNLIADLESVVGYALKAYPRIGDDDMICGKFNSNCNRVTQNAIYSLLTDLCLWNNDYQKAVNYAQIVLDSKYQEYEKEYSRSTGMGGGSPVLYKLPGDESTKGYPLYTSFSQTSFGNHFNKIFGTGNSFESIFELSFNAGPTGNYSANTAVETLYGNNHRNTNDGQGYVSLAEGIVTDLNGASGSNGGRVFKNLYDTRFYATVRATDISEYSRGYSAKYVKNEFKITTPKANGSKSRFNCDVSFGTFSDYTDRNWIFYRLTDVMLMQAEALIELGGEQNMNKAFGLIWAVNRRSLMVENLTTSTYELKKSEYNTQHDMRELCMNERRRELLFEGKRWFDMLRRCRREGNTDYIKNNVPSKTTISSSGLGFVNMESLYWPYNKDELKNNTLLQQKPFYASSDGEDTFVNNGK